MILSHNEVLFSGTANDIAISGNSETECALQIVGTAVNNGDTIQLRFTSPDWTVGYDITPTLTVQKSVDTQLVMQESSHAINSDTPSLLQEAILYVSESTHPHYSDDLALLQAHYLAVDHSIHTPTSDTPGLVQAHILAMQYSFHNHAVDYCDLIQGITLNVQNGFHGSSGGELAITLDGGFIRRLAGNLYLRL